MKRTRGVTLWFRSFDKAADFAAEAALCMTDHEEFDPAALLTLVANATRIRLGDKPVRPADTQKEG